MKEQLENALKLYETENLTVFYPGLREKFLNEIARTGIDFTAGTWRNKSGAKIDINNLIEARLQAGNFVRSKPSAKDYVSPFSKRTDAAKTAHKQTTGTLLKDLFKKFGYHFQPGLEDRAIEIISENFLPFDGESGISFSKITDTEVGTLVGSNELSLDDLLGQTRIHSWLDREKTEIAQMQHAATLRQTAAGMVDPGSKPAAINGLMQRLADFEKRSIKTGYAKPNVSAATIRDEFYKKRMLEVGDPAARHIGMRAADSGLESIDDLRDIQISVEQTEITKPEPKKFDGITY